MINFPPLVLGIGSKRYAGIGGVAVSHFPFCWSSLSIFEKIKSRWKLRVLGDWHIHRFFRFGNGVLVVAKV